MQKEIRTILNRFLAIALCAVLLLVSAPVDGSADWLSGLNFAAHAAEVASGTCGDNLMWTLDEYNTLTISGVGGMKDYSSENSAPWYNYRNAIQTVLIENGITNIGDYAFNNCISLSALSIASSVINIGFASFYQCSSLTTAVIPDGVTSIGEYALLAAQHSRITRTPCRSFCGIRSAWDTWDIITRTTHFKPVCINLCLCTTAGCSFCWTSAGSQPSTLRFLSRRRYFPRRSTKRRNWLSA